MYSFWKRGLASFQTRINVCNNNSIEYGIIIYKQSIKIKIVFLRFKKDCYPVHLAHLSTVRLFGVFPSHLRMFDSILPVRDFKNSLPILGTYHHEEVRFIIACSTNSDIGFRFIIVISEDPRHIRLL